jgi:release factor glutamine methyltransferase
LTVRETLRLGTERLKREGIESAGLDMSLLLAEVLGTNRLGLYLNLDRPLSPAEREAARKMLARRIKHEPVAYILGRREFYGLTFEVTPAVLIPRPETELLVEQAVAWINERAETTAEPVLTDIGTGSGAIAIATAHACPASRWIAVDFSKKSLEVARRNAEKHGVDERIEFRQGSLLEPIQEPLDGICANLPYVAERERAGLARDVADYEPHAALFSGPEGLDHIRQLIEEAPARLKPGGLLLLECGAGQDEPITQILTENDAFGFVRVHNDLAGIGRVIQTERAE